TITFSGGVGATTRLGTLKLVEADFEVANASTILASSLTINADIINFTGAAATNIGVGALTLAPQTPAGSIELNTGVTGAGKLSFTQAALSAIPTATSLVFGDIATQTVNVGNATLPAASTVQLRTNAGGSASFTGVLALTAPAAGTSSLTVTTDGLTV